MTDRIFVLAITIIRKIATKISIRELNNKIYYSDEYIVLIFYIKEVLKNNTRVFVKITREIYIVDNLKIRILIKFDILTSKRIVIDFVI